MYVSHATNRFGSARGWCMSVMLGLLGLVGAMTSASAAGPVQVGDVTLSPLGKPGAYTGFAVTVQHEGQQVQAATALLQAGGRWKAGEVADYAEGARRGLELRGIDTSGSGATPTLGSGSFVRVSLASGEVYPRVDFRLDVRAFDQKAWEAAMGQKAPLHFLALPLATARVWYVHGLLCPTPKWDPYPLTRATIRGLWADGWSYGAALGALTVPAMALWDDQGARMVGYEWAEARFTDKTDKDLGIAYCAGVPGFEEQFITLLSSYQRHWNELTYPATPMVLESHVRVMYSLNLPATADVNRLVMRHVFSDYAPILPQVPAMNDLSWMVDRRLDELGGYGPSGGGFLQTVEGGTWGWNQFFYDPGTVLFWGGYRDVDLMFKQRKTEAIERFNTDLAEFLKHVQWQDLGGDRCCFWRFPLTGSWNKAMGGEAADTTHGVQQFGVGAAMLAGYANTGRADLLPYIDGLLNYTRHYVFTRGDIADIPESMFTLQTGMLALNFLMNYHSFFAAAPDEEHRRRAEEALNLACMVVCRNANVTLGDSDERDNLSGAFMMPGNYAKYWLGIVGPAELCEPFRAMIMMYTETGDPVYKWLVRGALDKWWIGFKEDCWHTTENIDIWGESEGHKGAHSGIHGPCDDFWEWAEPVGDATMRVTVGAKGAIAFCKGTRALDVDQFSYAPPKSFRFRVARIAEDPVAEPFAIIVSSPWRDLSGLRVKVDGKEVTGDDLRVLGTYKEHLYVRGVKVGSIVEVGDVGGTKPVAMAEVPVAGGVRNIPPGALHLGDRSFRVVDLGAQASVRLATDWDSPDHWGGLPSGLAYADSVPYWVRGRAVGPGGKVALEGKEAYLFGVAPVPGALTVSTGGVVDLGAAPGSPAAEGWPLCSWKLRLYPVKLQGGRGEVRVGESGLLLGATVLESGPGLVEGLQEKIKAGEAEVATPETDEAVIAEARERLAAPGASERKPVAFIPPCAATYGALADCAEKLGLEAYTLTPQDFVDEDLFTAARFPVAIYTGGENYYRTVKQPGDGERALLRYLGEGGMLLVAGICHPFTYPIDVQADGTEKQLTDWILFNKQFELSLMGPGEQTRDAIGFEAPPAGVTLTMRLNPDQPVLWDFPKTKPFPEQGDLRYRPLSAEGVAPEDQVVPILTTEGSDGRDYGAAAALVNHGCTAFKGAQVLWVWGTLLQTDANRGDLVAAQMLTYAVVNARPATTPLPESMAAKLPPGGFRVAVLPPDCNGREDTIRAACEAVGAETMFLTIPQLVSHAVFNARNFPVAIQAPSNEQWVCSYLAPNDGEQAYKRYLREGGTLIVCQPATPFWFEMVYEGGKWKTRPPQRFWSMAFDLGFETTYGFERPEATMNLELSDDGRRLWPDLPQPLTLDYLRDQRWRSLIQYRSSAARRFTPLAYATKPDGSRYPGLAAAMIDFLDSEYGGARVIYMWGNMVEGAAGERMLAGCLRHVQASPVENAHHRPPP